MSFIQGNKFISLADFVFAPPNDIPKGDYRYLINTLDKRSLNNGDIIYTHSFYAKQLFEYLPRDKKITVITHNSDLNIDFPPPDNVLWYTQNVNIKHPRIKSIPIGLENDHWYPEKKTRLFEKLKKPKVYRNMLYMNHNTGTNPARLIPYKLFENESWVTAERGRNGQDINNYLDNVYNHPFVICPEGNGMDTHRTWECLYLRTIPIEKRNINNQFYTDLPICFVDEWEEINEIFLFNEFKRMVAVKWNLAKLNFDYWKNEIKSDHTIS
jgi:hypothetical protein